MRMRSPEKKQECYILISLVYRQKLTLSSRSDPHREATAHVDSAAASSSAMSAVCAYRTRNIRVCRKSYNAAKTRYNWVLVPLRILD